MIILCLKNRVRYTYYNNLGIAYARQMRLDEAVEMFKNAIRLTPGNVSFHHNLALAYNQQGKKAAAAAVMAHIKWLTGPK